MTFAHSKLSEFRPGVAVPAEIIIRATRTPEALGEKNGICCAQVIWIARVSVKIPRRGSRVVQAARRRRRNPGDTNFCLTVRRACCDVVRLNLETWLERLRGDDQWKNWTQRAKAVKPKDSHPTCQRGQDAVGRAVNENANRARSS